MNGDIECVGDVTIGEHGMAKSNISARNVTIAGVVSGNITTKGILSITSTGQLFGNATSQSLVIAEGGIFQGQSKMTQEQGKANTNTPEKEKENISFSQSYSSTSSAL